jgi:dienelactone hydrolase
VAGHDEMSGEPSLKRRDFLGNSARASLLAGIQKYLGGAPLLAEFMSQANASSPPASSGTQTTLPGTAHLTAQGDLALQMVDGIRRFLLEETERQAARRPQFWSRDSSSSEKYDQSVAPNRQHLREIIGVTDARVPPVAPGLLVNVAGRAEIAIGRGYRVFALRWRVFEPVTADSSGLEAAGLLLQPDTTPSARVVAIPDAAWTPEMLAGLDTGIPPQAQLARRLAENGVQVVVPVLINREDTYSGIPGIGMTNMSHREWLYRMCFEAGRHIIGFEVQKILAAVDWFETENAQSSVPIGVIGYGEGGLLALYTAALDTRIAATVVSGYFQPREQLWQEPIYRDVWGLLREFGDAELAGLVAPRTLIIESSKAPEITGPPDPDPQHRALACPNGRLTTPSVEAVTKEFARARPFFQSLGVETHLKLIHSEGGEGLPGSEPAIEAFLQVLGAGLSSPGSAGEPARITGEYAPASTMKEQFDELVAFIQALIRKSPDARKDFWRDADASSVAKWKESTRFYRDYIWDEVIGRLPPPSLPSHPRTRLVLSAPRFHGYEVMLDVHPNIFAYGILLLPNDLKPGERRPVVVCQHGLEGRPADVADPKLDHHFYHRFAANLAEEGFITYAPQNPYIGEDRFRIIQRLGHPLKLSLFSVILAQHEQTLSWLAAQPFCDPGRIGFYGLSYGGKTAVRVPPLLDGYALSICSGDFNEWVWKTTTVLAQQSYMLTNEYDMYEFDFANKVNYAELAMLMAPRPFMVERGHHDPVGVDEWVAFEYAKVREFYDRLGLGDRTEIEFFNGPHEIHGQGTFQFLKRYLHWPE